MKTAAASIMPSSMLVSSPQLQISNECNALAGPGVPCLLHESRGFVQNTFGEPLCSPNITYKSFQDGRMDEDLKARKSALRPAYCIHWGLATGYGLIKEGWDKFSCECTA